MYVRVLLVTARGAKHPLEISVAVTATVGDLAAALIGTGIEPAPEYAQTAAERLGVFTLELSEAPGAPGEERPAAVVLDHATPVRGSGISSGCQLRVVPDDDQETWNAEQSLRQSRRTHGILSVLDGPQQGAKFRLIDSGNTVGRAGGNRVVLLGRNISRKHLLIDAVDHGVPGLRVRDLDSANGMRHLGQPRRQITVTGTEEIQLGETMIQITVAPHSAASQSRLNDEGAGDTDTGFLRGVHRHTRSPVLLEPVSAQDVPLPQPPEPAPPQRFPFLAALGPLILGGVIFAVNGSALGGLFLALSPLLLAAGWLDRQWSAAATLRRLRTRFERQLEGAVERIDRLRAREARVRAAAHPGAEQIERAVCERSNLLWRRDLEPHPALELRFGLARQPSVIRGTLPDNNGADTELWHRLETVRDQRMTPEALPVVASLTENGAIGVAGPATLRAGVLRWALLQLATNLPPQELGITAFLDPAGTPAAPGHRDWLLWLPHLDPRSSPLAVEPLADTPESAADLLAALEVLLRTRKRWGQADGNNHPRDPIIVVLIDRSPGLDRARLIGLAEHGPAVGVYVLWASEQLGRVPAACQSFIDVGQDAEHPARLGSVRSGTLQEIEALDLLDAEAAVRIARQLAGVVDDAVADPSDQGLPRVAPLAELCPEDILGGADAILRRWADSHSLKANWVPGTAQAPATLSAVIGQGSNGPEHVDLRAQGPHALIGGTTGSGKSEFLQSWLMSLASQHSPERVTFLLIDYKGGTAFAECADLPHCVGLVTDLGPSLLRRALVSLRAELRHREKLLNELGAKDLMAVEARSAPETPPSLIVVVDELAALAADVPEFLDGLLDVAQRGRSLGVHLILATQRPAGVIPENVRANTTLRIALRVADARDSTDVLGTPAAATFDADIPGRAAVALGPGRHRVFQAAYLGGYSPDTSTDAGESDRTMPRPAFSIRDLGTGGQETRLWPPETIVPARQDPERPRDIVRLRDAIVAAAATAEIPTPRPPWLEPLPTRLALDALPEPSGPGILLGLRDEPEQQRQTPLTLDLARDGNALLCGASGTGKTSALMTLAVASNAAPNSPLTHVYVIDGTGALSALAELPTVGAVVPVADDERLLRLLVMLRETIAARSAAAPSAPRGTPDPDRGTEAPARLLLLLDGFAAFQEQAQQRVRDEDLLSVLAEVMSAGRAVGVHTVVTATRQSGFGPEIAASLQQRFSFRVAEDSEAVPGETATPPGRLRSDPRGTWAQVALLGLDQGEEPLAGLTRVAVEQRATGFPEAPTVPALPERLFLENLVHSPDERRPNVAVDVTTLRPLGLPLGELCVVSGPAGSGRRNALRTLTDAAWGAGSTVAPTGFGSALFAPVGSALIGRHPWAHRAHIAEERAQLAERLLTILQRDTPDSPAAGAEGAPGLIVIEDAAEATGTAFEAPLVRLLIAARNAGTTVIVEAEAEALAGAWQLLAEIKSARWTLLLRPHAMPGSPLIRATLPRIGGRGDRPGRGVVFDRGTVRVAQVAVSSGQTTPQNVSRSRETQKTSSAPHGAGTRDREPNLLE